MKIACVGGGPAGLYFAILRKLRHPRDEITVCERNAAGTTHGWAVVLSADFLDDLYTAEPVSARRLRALTHTCRTERVHIGTGGPAHLGGLYSFSIDRARLLAVLTERAQEVGVAVRHQQLVEDVDALEADLVVAADGAGSSVRTARTEAFGTQMRIGRNRYAWLGTERRLPGFTFAFERTRAGWVWCHAYPSSGATSTFIVECSPTTWAGLELDRLAPQQGLRLLESVFARHLDGNPLKLPGGQERSPWLQFREVRNTTWVHGTTVLLGDAAHTTHYSIASGTVLAVHDAIALAGALDADPDLPAALAAFDSVRRAALEPVHRAALTSMAWFEDVERLLDDGADPIRLAYAMFDRQRDQPAWRYPLHVLTQYAVLRRGRSALTAGRRAARTLRREVRGAAAPRPSILVRSTAR